MIKLSRGSREIKPSTRRSCQVAFDGRALATLRALCTFAQTTQVLLFTCHAHLVALVEAAQLEVTHLTLTSVA